MPDQPGQFALRCRLGQPREVVVHDEARVDVLEEITTAVATGASAPAIQKALMLGKGQNGPPLGEEGAVVNAPDDALQLACDGNRTP